MWLSWQIRLMAYHPESHNDKLKLTLSNKASINNSNLYITNPCITPLWEVRMNNHHCSGYKDPCNSTMINDSSKHLDDWV